MRLRDGRVQKLRKGRSRQGKPYRGEDLDKLKLAIDGFAVCDVRNLKQPDLSKRLDSKSGTRRSREVPKASPNRSQKSTDRNRSSSILNVGSAGQGSKASTRPGTDALRKKDAIALNQTKKTSDRSARSHSSQRAKRVRLVGGRYSAAKGVYGRSILDINLLRLLGARLPRFSPEDVLPPPDLGIPYGLVDATGKYVTILNESVSEKLQPARNRDFSSIDELRDFQKKLNLPSQVIYTDGSYYKNLGLCGYAVWWGENHVNNACGPVPSSGPLSSAKAEEYAIFLALLQIKAEVKSSSPDQNVVDTKKYVIFTDCLWAMNDILRWFRRWNKPHCAIGWKTQPTSDTVHREILRVAAGLLWDLRFRGAIVDLEYVKGHKGIFGNEVADLMAKFGSRSGQFVGPQPAVIHR